LASIHPTAQFIAARPEGRVELGLFQSHADAFYRNQGDRVCPGEGF
jgi:hypothetical protein